MATAVQRDLRAESQHMLGQRLLYPVAAAAEQLGVGTTFVWEAIRDGSLPALRLGRRVLVTHADLMSYIEARQAAGYSGGRE